MTGSTLSLASYLDDASGYQGEAEQVFLPASVQEVREIVASASAQNVPLTISGAGTGLAGGRVPHGGWVVSLERFRKIEIGSGSARVGAGASLLDLQAAALPSRQFFGPNPTELLASFGGAISTNAGGARSFRFGAVRAHVLALEVTFMDGHTRELRRGDRVDFPVPALRRPATTKNSAGYYMQPDVEWVDLLAGSEGTLGIITEAEVRLLPEPSALLSGVLFFPSDANALDAVDAWRGLDGLRLLEYIGEAALDFIRPRQTDIPDAARAALFIEQDLAAEDDPELDLWEQRLAEHRAFQDASWFGLSAADRDRFREFRHSLPVAVIERVRGLGYPKFGTDFAVPLARNREMLAYYRRRCEEEMPGAYVIFGHIGDANVHVNLLPTTDEQATRVEALMLEFAREVVRMGGTVAAEHGVGKQKADLLRLMYSADEIASMRAVKRRLDPRELLGRGNIFGVAADQPA